MATSDSHAIIDKVADQELKELERQERVYRGSMPPPEMRGRTVILVDDGLATGSTMRAAIAALRQREPKRLVVAVPVGSPETCTEFQDETDETVCAKMPEPFCSVGMWYDDFSQTTDDEVRRLLVLEASRESERAPLHPQSRGVATPRF